MSREIFDNSVRWLQLSEQMEGKNTVLRALVAVAFGVLIFAGTGVAQDAPLAFSSGPLAWGTAVGEGLVGMSVEAQQEALGLEVFLGIGTNRVQGWGLWPRVYFSGEGWVPFGELALLQLSETEISVDPNVGLIKNTFTWQFMGLGIGGIFRQEDRLLRVSVGLGVNGGQCLHCGMQAYASVHIGFSF